MAAAERWMEFSDRSPPATSRSSSTRRGLKAIVHAPWLAWGWKPKQIEELCSGNGEIALNLIADHSDWSSQPHNFREMQTLSARPPTHVCA